MSEKIKKSCGNCANCYKFSHEGKESWSCDEYGFYYLGFPTDVTPPNDKACKLWTDDKKKANTWEKCV